MSSDRHLSEVLHMLAQSEAMVPDAEARDWINHAATSIDRYLPNARVVVVGGTTDSWEAQQLYDIVADLDRIQRDVSALRSSIEDLLAAGLDLGRS